jgi:hypothetical protein
MHAPLQVPRRGEEEGNWSGNGWMDGQLRGEELRASSSLLTPQPGACMPGHCPLARLRLDAEWRAPWVRVTVQLVRPPSQHLDATFSIAIYTPPRPRSPVVAAAHDGSPSLQGGPACRCFWAREKKKRKNTKRSQANSSSDRRICAAKYANLLS